MMAITPFICMVIDRGCAFTLFCFLLFLELIKINESMAAGDGRYIGQPLNATNPLR